MTDAPSIRIQREPFDPGAELTAFSSRHRGAGAICSFVGQMRDFRGVDRISGQAIDVMQLEHYPGMAERQLAELAAEACRRWPLVGTAIVHRYGHLAPGDPIVFVATASAHRAEAFAGCEFLMDWLKTQAPFWKKETGPHGREFEPRWVAAEAADDARAARWSK
jgi:molybdopterin synthase catalytic subunit